MFKAKEAFSGFSVDDLARSKEYYSRVLGLNIQDEPGAGIRLQLPGGGSVFVYAKDDHRPATFTILNFVVDDIDQAVDELVGRGAQFEHYQQGEMRTDPKGIARGKKANMGPDIAWFKDPAGNFLSVIEN